MDKNIIGVTGRAGAGKDTVCNMAVRALEKRRITAKRIACADPLKEMCAALFGRTHGVPSKHFHGSQDDKNQLLLDYGLDTWTGRKILQYIGTEGFRHIAPDVWSRHMVNTAIHELGRHRAIFVSDVRFHSEADAIKEAGGIIVRVLRPEADNGENQGLAQHASEMELRSIEEDFVIDNKGRSLADLNALVQDFLCQLDFSQ